MELYPAVAQRSIPQQLGDFDRTVLFDAGVRGDPHQNGVGPVDLVGFAVP